MEGVRAIGVDRVDRFKKRKGVGVGGASDNKVRETEKGRTQPNQIRLLCSISGSGSNNPIMCGTG